MHRRVLSTPHAEWGAGAQVYHQYHNDMVENYGREYNALRGKAVKEGRLTTTGCPELF